MNLKSIMLIENPKSAHSKTWASISSSSFLQLPLLFDPQHVVDVSPEFYLSMYPYTLQRSWKLYIWIYHYSLHLLPVAFGLQHSQETF